VDLHRVFGAPLMRFARLPEVAIFHFAANYGSDEKAITSW
jgi:hypothetical protein